MRALVSIVLLLAACTSGPFHAPRVLGGRSYDAATLNHGFRVYQQNCRACHGDRGDGHGLSSTGMWPPPRDFSQGVFKFGRVPAPDLPPDSELARILRDGLNGTGMLAWRLSDADLDAVIAYLKTFSPRWQSEQPGSAVTAPADPIAVLDETAQHAAVVRGEALYHGKALCSSCHPAYVVRARLYELTRALGTPVPAYSPAMYASRVKDTELCWNWHSPAGAESLHVTSRCARDPARLHARRDALHPHRLRSERPVRHARRRRERRRHAPLARRALRRRDLGPRLGYVRSLAIASAWHRKTRAQRCATASRRPTTPPGGRLRLSDRRARAAHAR